MLQMKASSEMNLKKKSLTQLWQKNIKENFYVFLSNSAGLTEHRIGCEVVVDGS